MSMISQLKQVFGAWITAVAGAIDAAAAHYARPRQVLLREGEGNTFTITMLPAPNRPALPEVSFGLPDGRPHPPLPADWQTALRRSRIEIVLEPSHVMFRSLDFPRQAG